MHHCSMSDLFCYILLSIHNVFSLSWPINPAAIQVQQTLISEIKKSCVLLFGKYSANSPLWIVLERQNNYPKVILLSFLVQFHMLR